jgi:hypothetical protein
MKVSRILATGAAILAAVMVVSAPAHGAGTTDDTDQAVGQALIGAATSPRTAL